MQTIYRNPRLDQLAALSQAGVGHGGRQEVETRVPPPARPVLRKITVNGVAIPEAEILAETQNHPAADPAAALREATHALVVRELLCQEANRLGISAGSVPDVEGRAEVELDAVIRTLIEQEVRVPVAGEAECRRYYEEHPEKFCSATIHEARHILLAASPSDQQARREAKAMAQGLCGHLAVNPGEFSRLAREHSACPSRLQDGCLGQLTRGSTVPEFERALEDMQAGEIRGEPVETRFGFHVIALDRRVPGERLPFEAVRQRIAGWLEASVWSTAVAQYISILAGRAEIGGVDLDGVTGPLIQ